MSEPPITVDVEKIVAQLLDGVSGTVEFTFEAEDGKLHKIRIESTVADTPASYTPTRRSAPPFYIGNFAPSELIPHEGNA